MRCPFSTMCRITSGGVACFAFLALHGQTDHAFAQSAAYEVVSEATLKPGDPIPEPTGPVVLRVTGRINAGDRDVIAFDRPTLERLGVIRFTTSTNWTEGEVIFDGVLLSRLLEVVGADADATTLILTALNDYSAPMPVSDAGDWPVILALKENGAYMSLRERGPLWVVYPQDAYPELRSREYLSRWVWQLATITVE
jgi:hypothetical protein